METLKYDSSRTSLLKLTEIEAAIDYQTASSESSNKTDIICSDINNNKKYYKILIKKKLMMKYCSMLLLLFFTIMLSFFWTKVDKDFIEIIRASVDCILNSDPARIMPIFIWVLFVCFCILEKKTRKKQ